ncbi:MAG: tyrosine-type recombinase/integrase [Pseudomonadota bacterium]
MAPVKPSSAQLAWPIVSGALARRAPQKPASQNPVRLFLANRAPGSRPSAVQSLKTLARIVLDDAQADPELLLWQQLTYQHTAALRAILAERYKPATANRHLSMLRGVLKECFRLDLMTHEQYTRAVDVENVSGSSLPAGRAVSPGELRALVASCSGDGAGGARDAAALAILYGAGLRRAEAVALVVSDYQPADAPGGEAALRVVGKGNRERWAYLAASSARAVDAWLAVRGAESGPLLCRVNKGGRVELRPMTGDALYKRIKVRADKAGVAAMSPHDCRRSFVGDLLDAGVDLSTVQKAAGHASCQTTARYDRRGEQAKQSAVASLHFPYDPGDEGTLPPK